MMRFGLEEARKKLLQELEKETSRAAAPLSFPVVVRLKLPVVDIDLLQWLGGQKSPRKVYWHSPDGGFSAAGIGAAYEISAEGWSGFEEAWGSVREFMDASPQARLFAGMSFARSMTGSEWKGFTALKFILPAVELTQDHEGCWLVVNAVRGRDGEPFGPVSRETLASMRFSEQISDEDIVTLSYEDTPDYEDWVCTDEAMLESMENEGIAKMVMARRTTFELQGSFTPEAALTALVEGHKNAASFLFSIDGGVFFGFSSKSLYSRSGQRVQSHAIAGERPRGKDPVEDEALRADLLKSDKDQDEHRLVAKALIEVFREFCRSYQVDCDQDVLKLNRHQHLRMRVSGVVNEGVTDKEFLLALNPPSIACGVPSVKARMFLQEYEVFDRGWFSGSVGFLSREHTELAVVTRGCLLEDGRLHGYAGVPCTKGADPSFLWEEATREMKAGMNIVRGCCFDRKG